jgi:hypothetical protein
LSEIEYFILKKKKDDKKYPTVFDLTFEKVEKLNSDMKEQFA